MKPSPEQEVGGGSFAARFRARFGPDGAPDFARFMDLALYDPETGYYARGRDRVGGEAGTDFVTASMFGAAFGPLVAAAAVRLLGGADPGAHKFVEIGAEPGRCVLDGVAHAFGGVRVLRLGEPLRLHGRMVVFSNELFDAQPFHRIVRRAGVWRESGVALGEDGLRWVELPRLTDDVARLAERGVLPATAPEGWVLDLPLRATALARTIAGQPWSGLFLAFDYGRTWRRLVEETPAGTGRAYHGHRLVDDLLARPGEQDLTCDVCWDWLEEALLDGGFTDAARMSQERFFVHHAADAIAAIVDGDRDPLSRARSQLRELIHPALMGRRFEVLSARRLGA